MRQGQKCLKHLMAIFIVPGICVVVEVDRDQFVGVQASVVDIAGPEQTKRFFPGGLVPQIAKYTHFRLEVVRLDNGKFEGAQPRPAVIDPLLQFLQFHRVPQPPCYYSTLVRAEMVDCELQFKFRIWSWTKGRCKVKGMLRDRGVPDEHSQPFNLRARAGAKCQ